LYAQTLEQRVDRLERIADNPVLLQHSQRFESQQREIQGLYDQIDHLTRQLNQLQTQLAESMMNAEGRLDRLETQVDNLSLPLVEHESAVDPVNTQDQIVIDPDSQPLIEEATGGLSVEMPDLSPEQPPIAELELTPEIVSEPSPREHYDQAFQLLRENKFDQSIVLFTEFVEKNPADSLTSNAYYWLGEAYMIKQDFDPAYQAFNVVIEQFADTNKYADALLRGADSLVGLNRLDEAQAMYRKLIQQVPSSRSAKTAERRLERFN
jgi:tol-pal system protein YbgF